MAALAELCIDGPITRADVARLSARLSELLEEGERATVVCRLQSVLATGETLEVLARLALLAGRQGSRVRLSGASSELLELIAFAGLDEVFSA